MLTTSCASPATIPVSEPPTSAAMTLASATTLPAISLPTANPPSTAKPSVSLKPANIVLGDLTTTPATILENEKVTYSIPVSNNGETEGSYTVVFNFKSSTGTSGSDKVEVILKAGETRTVTLTKTLNTPGTYFINVNDKNSKYSVTAAPPTIYAVPAASASGITSPPSSMAGIDTHKEMYGQDADPNMVTLGPKQSFDPNKPGYATKHSMAWELKTPGRPVLAPIDMVLVGFQNSSVYQVKEGQNTVGFDDLDLWFESASADWPGMIIYVYHLSNSPLLLGQDIDPNCSACQEGQRSTFPAQGHLYMPYNDYVVTNAGNGDSCKGLLGYKVKRGELIGYAGTLPAGTGTHSFVDIGFKVSDKTENPLFGLNPKGLDPTLAQTGNRYLHWVQPSAFFYWKSYSPEAIFPSGVLAYPFECDGYQIPAEQRDVHFKYSAQK
jgi:hypothetical protein